MGGAIYNTKGMGVPTYGLLLSLIVSWHLRLVQHVLHQRFFTRYSLDTWGCSVVALLLYNLDIGVLQNLCNILPTQAHN